MITTHTFETDDIAAICGDIETVKTLDVRAANYLTALVNNFIDQAECEEQGDYSQLHLLIAEADGLQDCFVMLASDSMFGAVQELQPIIIEALKRQGVL